MSKAITHNLLAGQLTTPWGGALTTLPTNYRISETPIGDVAKWGALAHVSDQTRERIIATGHGEMKCHIDHITKSIGQIKKIRKRLPPGTQMSFDLGE